MTASSIWDRYSEIAEEYVSDLIKEAKDALADYKVNIAQPQKSEVLGGLISRQIRLVTQLVRDPNNWPVDIYGIFLRCMIETYIITAWFVKQGKPEDFQSFIEYGIGQEKLALEHLKHRANENPEKNKDTLEYIKSVEEALGHDIRPDFAIVDVGAWTPNHKNMRQIAEEAGCGDYYKYIYTPYSSILHGTWNALWKYNLDVCKNPLHKYHRIPSFDYAEGHLEVLEHTAEIMDKTFLLWSEAILATPVESKASISMFKKIANIKNEFPKEPETKSADILSDS